jgi:hypothetical protein
VVDLMASADRRLTRLLRWYPRSWRQRYGGELQALVEDTYGDAPMPWRDRRSIVRAGLHERVRASGLAGSDDPAERVTSGALLVLCAWSVIVIGGSAFAKFAEHWDAATPGGSRAVPSTAYTAIVVAAGCGAVLILAAAASVMPMFVRFLQAGGWPSVRRQVWRAVWVTAGAVLATTGFVAWAHHLGSTNRNGALWPYGIVTLGWAALIAASIACWTSAVVTTICRLELSDRLLRRLGRLAMLALVPLGVVTLATFVWWYSVATSAPSFFDNAGPGSTGSVFAPLIVGAGCLMLLATGVGLSGAARVRSSLRFLDRA